MGRFRQLKLASVRAAWRFGIRPRLAPSEIRRRVLCHVAARAEVNTFIETGTFRGETAELMAGTVERVITVELDRDLALAASRRLPSVNVIVGDSATQLPTALEQADGRTLVFLDGHWDGPSSGTARGDSITPIEVELQAIDRYRPDFVVVDDMRLFGRHKGYPSVGALVTAMDRMGYEFEGSILDMMFFSRSQPLLRQTDFEDPKLTPR